MAKRKYEEANIQAIADAIREKTGTEKLYKTRAMASGIDDVYEAGKNTLYDIVLNGGKKTSAEYTFYNWNTEYIRPPFVFKPTTRTMYCFRENHALKKIEKQYLDFSGVPSNATGSNAHYYTCYYCSQLEVFEDIGLPPSAYTQTWGACSKLHTIELVRSTKETVFSNPFNQCTELVEIRFEGEIGQDFSISSCGKLSDASVDNIIDHLADLTGETAKTIYFHTNIVIKLTEEQHAKITNKNYKLG